MGRAWVADDGRMGRFADMHVDQRQATGATPTGRREPISQLTSLLAPNELDDVART
jgi:hypothetical protein